MSHPFCSVATTFPPYLGLDGKPHRHELDFDDELNFPPPPLQLEHYVHRSKRKGIFKLKFILASAFILSLSLITCAQISGFELQQEAEESTAQIKDALASLALPTGIRPGAEIPS